MAATIVSGTISQLCIDGGDAAELTTRLIAAFAASAAEGLFLADLKITGTGDGPRWLCTIARTDSDNGGTLAAFSALGLAAVRVEGPATGGFPAVYVAIQLAGASSGRAYMVVATGTFMMLQNGTGIFSP